MSPAKIDTRRVKDTGKTITPKAPIKKVPKPPKDKKRVKTDKGKKESTGSHWDKYGKPRSDALRIEKKKLMKKAGVKKPTKKIIIQARKAVKARFAK